jgi:hypothetical protein
MALLSVLALQISLMVGAQSFPKQNHKNNTIIEYYLDKVNAESIQSYMQSLEDFGTRFCLADNRKEVAEWIRDKFISFGYHDVKLDSFPFNRTFLGVYYETYQYNVVCTYEGYTKPDSIFVLGAHHDSVNTYPWSESFTTAPGADDNASGVAGTLEIARIFKQYNYAPAYTIKFVTFAAEELGLHGAWDFANKAQAAGMNIACMINNDMISHTSLPQDQWTVNIQKYSNSDYFTALANHIIDNYTILNAVESTEYINRSDSWPFFQRGYRAIFFIEDEFTPHYHTANDLVVNTNKNYAAEMVKISLGMLVHENGPGYTTTPDFAFWIGNENPNWENNQNWSNKLLPYENSTVVIHPNTIHNPLITDNLEVKGITINTGTSITISPQGELTVTDDLVNFNGLQGITIESNQSSTGSLIATSPAIEATVQRYIGAADWQDAADGWHFVSSPVSNQSITQGWTTSPAEDYDFYAWQNGWLNQKVTANNITNFVPGKGYLVAYRNSATKIFEGELNAGQVDVELKYTSGNDYSGFNLIGNPYPSAIDWNLADLSKFQDNFAYIYNTNKSGGAGYETIDGTFEDALIAPHQGFFVLALDNQNGQNFSFQDSMRKHGGSWLKNNIAPDFLALKLASQNLFDKTMIRKIPSSLEERDPKDALKFFSFNAAVPQIYSISTDGVQLAINTLPNISQSTNVPLGLVFPETGNYTISATSASGLFASGQKFLLDKQTNTLHNLNQNPNYQFFASQGSNTSRFEVLFASPTNIETVPEDQATVYFWGGNLFIDLLQNHQNLVVNIFDTSGRLVAKHHLGSGTSFSIPIQKTKGIYIVQIFDGQSNTIRKVFAQ